MGFGKNSYLLFIALNIVLILQILFRSSITGYLFKYTLFRCRTINISTKY